MSKIKDIDWNDILTLLIHAYSEKPDSSIVSIGHWFSPLPGVLEANGTPRPEVFSAHLKLTVADLKLYAEPCEWIANDDVSDTVWLTSCDNAFYFENSGGPFENDFSFCPYCGRRLTTACTGLSGQPAPEADKSESPANQ